MNQIHFHSVLILLFASSFSFAQTPPPKPNILLIVADDLGWADVGYHGSKFQTPTLDKLAREGIELDRHYVQPVCSPTRTALLSGRWTSRFGPHVLSPTNLRAFPPGTTTLASALRDAGYSTYIAGKWHLGSKPEWGPQNYGFDQSYGSLPGAVDPWTHKYRKGPFEDTWHRDGVRIDEEGNATELVAAEVGKWIRAKKSPWFIYVPFHAVHIPVDAPDQYKQLYKDIKLHDNPAKDESLHRYAAMVSQMDAKIAGFIAALEETGQRQNTLILFTSDNGGLQAGDNPYVGKTPGSPALSSNAPLRGWKNQLYEGGIRVPALANFPGVLKPRKLAAPLHVADWMPTLTTLANCQFKSDPKFDGQNVWPILTAQVEKPAPRTIYIPHPSGAALLHDGWKLIARRNKQAETYELYNVEIDPSETTNQAQQEPQRLEQLQTILTNLRKDDQTKLPPDLGNTKE